MTTIETIFYTAIIIYFLRILIFWVGAIRERKKNSRVLSQFFTPFVSIIIPAREEEANIERCIRSLSANTFPPDSFEIIAVNDRSSDATPQILARLSEEISQLRVVHTSETSGNPNLRGKTRALDQGIAEAKGEILMMTDADCTVGKDWIASIAALFSEEKTGLVASFTVIDAKTLFDKLQAAEWVYNHTLASAGIGLNQPLGCFGNNLSIRARVYREIGGFSAIPFSVTEDLALLQTVAKTSWNIRYVCANSAKVSTQPAEDFSTFYRQHKRWAKGGQALGWRAAIFVISSAALWLGVAIAIATGSFFWLSAILLVRVLGDFLIIKPSLEELELNDLEPLFPLAVFFMMLIELVAPVSLLNKSVVWKGQIFR